MSDDEIGHEAVDHLAEHREEARQRRAPEPPPKLAHLDVRVRHLAEQRGVCSRSLSAHNRWEPLDDDAPGAKAEFVRRVQALALADPSGLFGNDAFESLAAYCRDVLGVEVAR
jgi:hypothetical protein